MAHTPCHVSVPPVPPPLVCAWRQRRATSRPPYALVCTGARRASAAPHRASRSATRCVARRRVLLLPPPLLSVRAQLLQRVAAIIRIFPLKRPSSIPSSPVSPSCAARCACSAQLARAQRRPRATPRRRDSSTHETRGGAEPRPIYVGARTTRRAQRPRTCLYTRARSRFTANCPLLRYVSYRPRIRALCFPTSMRTHHASREEHRRRTPPAGGAAASPHIAPVLSSLT